MTNYEYKRVRRGKINRYTRNGWEVVGAASAFGVYTVRRPDNSTSTHTTGFTAIVVIKCAAAIIITVAVLQAIIK